MCGYSASSCRNAANDSSATVHGLVAHHVGRAPPLVEQRHLAERDALTEGREPAAPVARVRRVREQHVDPAGEQEEHRVGDVALAEHDACRLRRRARRPPARSRRARRRRDRRADRSLRAASTRRGTRRPIDARSKRSSHHSIAASWSRNVDTLGASFASMPTSGPTSTATTVRPGVGERLGQRVEHRERGFVDARDVLEVDDDEVDVVETRRRSCGAPSRRSRTRGRPAARTARRRGAARARHLLLGRRCAPGSTAISCAAHDAPHDRPDARRRTRADAAAGHATAARTRRCRARCCRGCRAAERTRRCRAGRAAPRARRRRRRSSRAGRR